MKEPARVKKFLKTLNSIEECLEYVFANNETYLKEFRNDIEEMRQLIKDLSLDRKEDHAKFFDTLKKIYKVEKK